jgi:NAD(P)H-nitrite reductase large subunit
MPRWADEIVVCRCEEVTAGELRAAIREGATTLRALKRATRAGAGACQANTCAPLLARLVAEETGQTRRDIAPDTARAPVRSLRVGDLAALEGDEAP